MQAETLTMLMEILKKLGCSEETMNAVKNDPALKSEEESPEEDSKEESETTETPKEEGAVVVVAKKEEDKTPLSPMKEMIKGMLKSK